MSDDARDQSRVFAESYILMCIDAFDDPAARRLMREVEGSPYNSPDDWRRDFEASESISQAQFDAIRRLWREQRATRQEMTPAEFARDWAERIFPDMRF